MVPTTGETRPRGRAGESDGSGGAGVEVAGAATRPGSACGADAEPSRAPLVSVVARTSATAPGDDDRSRGQKGPPAVPGRRRSGAPRSRRRTCGESPRSSREEEASAQLKAGDLVFRSGLGHVMLYAGNGRIIHSPTPAPPCATTPSRRMAR
ncbi:MAG: hypothetical protein GEV03_04280 [Streptosporangiales bacterium]|nr:hypothetical protein [Streptosporangiales bacterium]